MTSRTIQLKDILDMVVIGSNTPCPSHCLLERLYQAAMPITSQDIESYLQANYETDKNKCGEDEYVAFVQAEDSLHK